MANIERMSVVLVFSMVVVFLALALGVVLLLAWVLRREVDKVQAARASAAAQAQAQVQTQAPAAVSAEPRDTEDTAPVNLPKP